MEDNILFRGSGLVYWDHFLKLKKTTNDRITRFICPGFLKLLRQMKVERKVLSLKMNSKIL